MTDKNILFNMTLSSAMEFYKRASDLDPDTEQERFNLLMQMAKEGKFETVVSTSRTREQVIKDLTEKHGFKVTEVTTEEK